MHSPISNEQLHEWNQRGWIPGPAESEEDFLKRIQTLQHFFAHPPRTIGEIISEHEWQKPREITKELFDFSPDWVISFYSNQQLSFFQAAATWIFEKLSIKIPLIQLREKLKREKLLGMYQKEEILAHEALHAARMAYDEPKFEEIFAYMTSPSRFRRFLGPLFRRSCEAWILLLSLFFGLAMHVMIEVGNLFQEKCIFIFLPPLLIFSYFFGRLLISRAQLSQCFCKLKNLIEIKQARSVLVRLTDAEIIKFSHSTEEEITNYFRKHTINNLRLRLLFYSYINCNKN